MKQTLPTPLYLFISNFSIFNPLATGSVLPASFYMYKSTFIHVHILHKIQIFSRKFTFLMFSVGRYIALAQMSLPVLQDGRFSGQKAQKWLKTNLVCRKNLTAKFLQNSVQKSRKDFN